MLKFDLPDFAPVRRKKFSLSESIGMIDFNVVAPEDIPHCKKDLLSFWEKKQVYFREHLSCKERKNWYFDHYVYYRYRLREKHKVDFLISLKLSLHLSFVRWMIVDFLRGKARRFKDIYLFVGLPGEGKTISMVAHIERALEKNPDLVVATNFHYASELYSIGHWVDIIKISLDAHKNNRPCLVAIDEVQNTFDASEWKNFPSALYSLLSFNRKLNLQFLCSAQIYERIPSKIRQLANYTVICKNVWKADRYFVNYYFEKNNYESSFDGKRAKAEFIREFIADDELYSKYNTFEQIKTIKGKAEEEKSKKQEAFDLLFGSDYQEDAEPDASSK